jgi:hypothetical protein
MSLSQVHNSVANADITGHADMTAEFVGGTALPSSTRWLHGFSMTSIAGSSWVLLRKIAPVVPGSTGLIVELRTKVTAMYLPCTTLAVMLAFIHA